MNATTIAAGVRDGSLSASVVVRDVLARIAGADASLGAFVSVFEEHAVERAEAIDARRARGERLGPLAGVPVAVKDNICVDHG
ncbi:MAG: amidase family protein, partial [Phycisphaerales bacterium JB041]